MLNLLTINLKFRSFVALLISLIIMLLQVRDLKHQLDEAKKGANKSSYEMNTIPRGGGRGRGRGRGARGGFTANTADPHGDKSYGAKLALTCPDFNSVHGCTATQSMPGFCVGTGAGKLKHACNKQMTGDNICWMRHPVTEHR